MVESTKSAVLETSAATNTEGVVQEVVEATSEDEAKAKAAAALDGDAVEDLSEKAVAAAAAADAARAEYQ